MVSALSIVLTIASTSELTDGEIPRDCGGEACDYDIICMTNVQMG